MTIWIDIFHTPQFNFYKTFILALAEKGYKVNVTILQRGRTPKIVQHEIGTVPNIYLYFIGKHRMTKLSAMLEANLLRIPQLLWWRLWHKCDIAFSNGFHAAMINFLFGKKSYSFDDDPDTFDFKPKRKFNKECNFCLYDDPVTEAKGDNVHVLRCLKEWAYLNPRTFKPNVKVLEKYGLQPKQYLFLREVSVGTVNYAAQSPQAILSISPLIQQFTQWCQAPLCKNPLPNTEITQWGQSLLCNSSSSDPTITQKGQTPLCIQENSSICTEGQSPCANFKVLFSLEEKHRRSEYPADWILLQEPIEDIHSLMYYAAGLVSSGDSMAREAALLGIPAYYLGVRHSMPANLAASKVANLQNETTQPLEAWLMEVRGKSEVVRTREQEDVRRKIDEEFIDINQYMLSLVEGEKELNR